MDDDPGDFPPTAYPGRECLTFAIAILVVFCLVIWSGWELFWWLYRLSSTTHTAP